MHPRATQVFEKALVATSLLVVTPAFSTARADDTGFFGRLFRGGGSSSSSPNPNSPDQSGGASYGRPPGPSANGGAPGSSHTPTTGSSYGGLSDTPVTTPPTAGPSGPGQRVSPRPRVSSAVTSADPLLTRFALGRSNDGSQFGMFLQIFADGTVIDSEGVHHLRAADLKPIMDLVSSGDLSRARGHCGAPATDFIEYVHVVVYERRLGRLSANSFSYSGNTQGCDHAIRHLHTTLENLQVKLSKSAGASQPALGASGNPIPMGPATSPGSAPALDHQPAPPAVNRGQAAPAGGVIPLTPIDSPH
jgi:hypothetical protein